VGGGPTYSWRPVNCGFTQDETDDREGELWHECTDAHGISSSLELVQTADLQDGLWKFADRCTPMIRMVVTSATSATAGRFEKGPVNANSRNPGSQWARRRTAPESATHESFMKCRSNPTTRPLRWMQRQNIRAPIPADDPSKNASERRIGVGVGRARDRDHGRVIRRNRGLRINIRAPQSQGDHDAGTGIGRRGVPGNEKMPAPMMAPIPKL